jgi:hypothetical protein
VLAADVLVRAALGEYVSAEELGRPKAKVCVVNGPVGVVGETGELTSWINIYRKRSGSVHGSPGRPE